YIPQNYALFPHMKVYDNIVYGLKLRKIPKNEIDKRIREIAETLEISHLLHRKPETLSGGEAQRVAIARALILEPRVILLDEPFANLDPQTRAKLIQEMKRWRKELNFTALHVTHSFEEAVSLGDRVGVMLNGTLIQTGDVREVFSKPKNEEVAKFLGFENIIEGIAEGRILRTSGISIELPIEVKGKVRIGIRPEDIVISSEPTKSSARNEFKARVLAVEDLGSLARLTLDVGVIQLRAFITRSSLIEMGIEEGKEVYLSFKATAIHVF
ncbi:MAG TPA: ABC transporter ATP-binding protein, partial [Thermococcus litoralis]|nr:ABC transporter ATP-binding protein [Thermococcus litoralis]